MKKIREELLKLGDEKYREFSQKITPNIQFEKVIGIKIPILRNFAKELIKDDYYRHFLDDLPHKYHEENLLHGLLISNMKDYDSVIKELNRFLPFIDNWAVCDTTIPHILKKDLNKTFEYIKECLNSKEIYKVRFGIITLMRYYLDGEFKEDFNNLIKNIKSDEYYINMAIAWYFSFALIKQYDATVKIFEKKELSKWVHNKSLQKAIESFRINNHIKDYLRTLKIK